MEILEYCKRQFMRDAVIAGFFIGLGQFCMFAANSCVFALSKKLILDGDIDSEDMGLAMNIVMTSASGIGQGMGNIGDLKKAKIAFKCLYSTIDTESLISAFKDDNEGKVSPENIKGKIEFKNVYFAYPTRPEQIILKDVSFVIEPGQQAALVGYSGSGKSTVIQLLERFYDVEDGKGEILIDDVNIKDYDLNQLRKKIGLVSQEPVLFKRSVLENVRYGKLDATNEECIQAAKEANIMKFFTEDKMNEVIGENNKDEDKNNNKGDNVGKKEDPVSGGEKQRLAIARAFLKNPVILLLDEATSALDKDSELEVQKSLDKLSSNRTSIAIAHRLSTIEKCNKIFVLENGRLVEQGTHQELMKLKNKYYTLHKYSDAS
jgi:ATP-binding cassette subfamily B (MDR/TAP) protein 1